ncbi:MAG TPA: Na+/H+ antiporter NhaA [Thermomicrobiales bacterium]|nr:Na+/H+ antiporter NhaA [Thermomicrobiales bacterium]
MNVHNAPRAPLPPHPRVLKVISPFQNFSHTEASGGILLFIATVAALIWANSAWSSEYFDFWHTEVTIQFGQFGMSMTLVHWINDGLMAIFFFVVGLEIKREFLVGELASIRQAILPIAAAVGGAVLPALLYLALNAGGEGARGWGVPMATDIAFALGVLAILGSRVPIGLKVFLTALAIVDDILAVLVIAIFYSDSINLQYLLLGLAIIVVLLIANQAGIRQTVVYAVLGLVVWIAFIESGVHATVAGVLLAMTIPSRTRIDSDEFVERSRNAISNFEKATEYGGKNMLTNKGHLTALHELEVASDHAQAPMQKLEENLHTWVAFLIVPIFALANAGVSIGDNLGEALTSPISLGIVVGLVFGKQIGITLVSWLLVRAGLSSLPEGVGWHHIYGAACLAGIGFTMSLFVADLAFLDEENLALAKIGILGASVIAGAAGFLLIRLATKPQSEQETDT